MEKYLLKLYILTHVVFILAFFIFRNQKNIKKRDLRETYKISPTIISRLSNNANVAVDTIMYLCEILNCQPSDIMEYIPPESV